MDSRVDRASSYVIDMMLSWLCVVQLCLPCIPRARSTWSRLIVKAMLGLRNYEQSYQFWILGLRLTAYSSRLVANTMHKSQVESKSMEQRRWSFRVMLLVLWFFVHDDRRQFVYDQGTASYDILLEQYWKIFASFDVR
jgi:hypothetical protein